MLIIRKHYSSRVVCQCSSRIGRPIRRVGDPVHRVEPKAEHSRSTFEHIGAEIMGFAAAGCSATGSPILAECYSTTRNARI